MNSISKFSFLSQTVGIKYLRQIIDCFIDQKSLVILKLQILLIIYIVPTSV